MCKILKTTTDYEDHLISGESKNNEHEQQSKIKPKCKLFHGTVSRE